MRSLLVIHHQANAPEFGTEPADPAQQPEWMLRTHGYDVALAASDEQAKNAIAEAEAVVLSLPITQIKSWSSRLAQWKTTPLFWWCSESAASMSLEACEDDVKVDGVLLPSMRAHELHWSLHFGIKMSYERQQWQSERAQLLGRIEERKWIDMAKGILCEIKHISESEAYDLLRKQAMNERKRMVDVAISIVKVYQLLQEQKQGGAKRR